MQCSVYNAQNVRTNIYEDPFWALFADTPSFPSLYLITNQ